MKVVFLLAFLGAQVSVFLNASSSEDFIIIPPSLVEESDDKASGRKGLIRNMARNVQRLSETLERMEMRDEKREKREQKREEREQKREKREEKRDERMEKILSFLVTMMKARRTDANDSSIRARGISCPPPFVEHDSMCLLAFCEPRTWLDARRACAGIGAALVWLQADQELLAANVFFKRSCGLPLYWTSLHRRGQNGELTWSESAAGNGSWRLLNANETHFASTANGTALRGQRPNSSLAFVCRRASKAATDLFQPIEVKNLDIAASATSLGRMGLTACRKACASRPTCPAFDISPRGCFILEKKSELWRLRADAPSSRLFVRATRLTSNCSWANFPAAIGASRYRFEREERTWDDARANCEARGGKLAELPSEVERQLVSKEASRRGKGWRYYPWVGLRQLPGSAEPQGGWRWDRSGLPVTSGWLSSKPDNGKGKSHAGTLHYNSAKLGDYDETSKFPSICECSVIE